MVTLKPGFRRIQVFLCHDEPKSELARDLGTTSQSPSLLETLATVDNPGMCNKPLKNFVVNKKETEYNTFVKLCFVT